MMETLGDVSSRGPGGMSVVAALQVLAAARGPDDIVVTNQGSARVWPQISQHPLDFAYNPSTMGGAVPLALGLALAQPRRQVIVVSGDGALLMSLGSLVTVAAAKATNLSVVVLENGLYEVTGGQQTPGTEARVDFTTIARGSGFATELNFAELTPWQSTAREWLRAPGPRFASLLVAPTPPEYLQAKGPRVDEQLDRLTRLLA